MTRYEHGFLTKCAEYGVDGRPVLLEMQKRAGIGRSARKIGIKTLRRLSPKVTNEVVNTGDYAAPGLLKRLFTKTKIYPILDDVSRGGGGAGSYGGYGAAVVPDIMRDANPKAIRVVSRLAPGRVAAALAGTTGLAGVAADVLSSGKSMPDTATIPPVVDSPSGGGSGINVKHLLAALGLAGAGAVGAAAYKKSRDKKKKKNAEGD